MTEPIDPRIEQYAFDHTRPAPEALEQLAEFTRSSMEAPQMLTGRVEGRFLKLLVQLCRPRLVVEVGTFTGYSALSMAEGLVEGGRIITCEIDPQARDVAKRAFDASPLGHKIELKFGPALDTIRQIKGAIDLSFIDADKTGYGDYYEELLARTSSGGLLVLDNMLQHGRVLDPCDDASKAIHALNNVICRDDRVENVLLTVRDGVQLVRKR